MDDKLNQNPKDKAPWTSWKDHSNNQAEGGGSINTGGMDPSMFKYQDETPDAISDTKAFPDNGFQKNPKKD